MIIDVQILQEKMKKPVHTPHGTFARHLNDFMKSDNKSIVVTCASKDEAMRCYHAFDHKRKKENLNIVIWQKNCVIYVTKG